MEKDIDPGIYFTEFKYYMKTNNEKNFLLSEIEGGTSYWTEILKEAGLIKELPSR